MGAESLGGADWQRLKNLRARFLQDATADYWSDARDLELYDAVFGERIRWKWAAVLGSLNDLDWKPVADHIVDWGCGSGVASRIVSEWTGIRRVQVWDQSAFAMDFAAKKHREQGNDVSAGSSKEFEGSLLLISHVLNELAANDLETLLLAASRARSILWVEPGNHECSRLLSGARDRLIDAGFSPVAPCTHALACPMLLPENERHWCHFFAQPPTEVFQSAFWREVSLNLEIDLRSLPYSFFVASKASADLLPDLANAERLIGKVREGKGHCQLLCCGCEGLQERLLQKREQPELFRQFTKKGLQGVFRWERDPQKTHKILSGSVIGKREDFE